MIFLPGKEIIFIIWTQPVCRNKASFTETKLLQNSNCLFYEPCAKNKKAILEEIQTFTLDATTDT